MKVVVKGKAEEIAALMKKCKGSKKRKAIKLGGVDQSVCFRSK